MQVNETVTNVQCNYRWFHIVEPQLRQLKKTPWSVEEVRQENEYLFLKFLTSEFFISPAFISHLLNFYALARVFNLALTFLKCWVLRIF
jgi:hypothetical protein